MNCTPTWENLIFWLNFDPPQRATPFLWNVARYEPRGDHRTYVSDHLYETNIAHFKIFMFAH